MAGVNKRSMGVLVVCLALLIQTSIAATSHTVGDSTGWTIPTTSSSFYSTWASKQTFSVGDSLVFPYTTGHTVAEVSKAEYSACTGSNPISISSNGPTTIKLTTAGTHYFICTVSGHCSAGQKLAVTTASSTTSTPPSQSPTASSPSPTTASAPTPSTSSGTALTPSDVASSPTTVPTSPSPAGGSTAPAPTSSATVAGAGLVMPFVMIAAALLV